MENFNNLLTTTIEFNKSEFKIVKKALELFVITCDNELKNSPNCYYIFQHRLAIKLMFKIIDKTERV